MTSISYQPLLKRVRVNNETTPPAIAKIGTRNCGLCERFNFNSNIATCAGGLLSMVRLRRETRVGSVLHPTVPEPGRVSRRGAQSKKCRRKPRRGNRLPGGCCWFATSSGDEKPTHSSEISASALREAAAPSAPGAPSARPSARRTTERSRLAVRRRRSLSSRRTRRKFAERFSISEDVAAQPPSPSRPRAECWQCSGVAVDQTAAYRERSEIYGDASQMQSPWKAPSSPK